MASRSFEFFNLWFLSSCIRVQIQRVYLCYMTPKASKSVNNNLKNALNKRNKDRKYENSPARKTVFSTARLRVD